MNSQTNTIPANVAAIIEEKKSIIQKEQQAKQEKDQREKNDSIEKGKVVFNERLQTACSEIPTWMMQYLQIDDDVDYERIARGWDNLSNIYLRFDVPGLAPIMYSDHKKAWKTSYSHYNEYSEDSKPEFSFRDTNWEDDFAYVLYQAEKHNREFDADMRRWAELQANRLKLYEQREQEEKEREDQAIESGRQHKLREEKQKAEQQYLFDAIKSDPVAIHFLKAFVLLRDERSYFEERLYDADETISSIENRWSHRAEELRRQAADADRRAEDERSRLQSDLYDAEDKLKKAEKQAQRGW